MRTKWIALCTAMLMLVGSISGFAASFDDVGEAHDWAKVTIEEYAERGILSGDGKGSFMPDNSVTRAEFAKMLCLVFSLDTVAELAYEDVEKDSWQYDYIAKTDAYTYTADEKLYAPDQAATRAEIAYAIVNAAELEMTDAEMPFVDVQETNTVLLENVQTAYALGLLKGYPDNTFRPNGAVTRAEAVVLLSRAEAAMEQKVTEEESEEVTETEPEQEKPAPETEETYQSIQIQAMETLCYIDSVSHAIDPKKDEERIRLRFYVGGSEQLHTLYIDKNVPIYGASGARASVQKGDVICVNTNLYGNVKEVYVVLRMGDSPILSAVTATEHAFFNKLLVPTAHKWGYLEEDKKHEVYLGFLGDLEYENDVVKLQIYAADGKRSSDGVRILSLPSDTKVTTYTTNAKKKNRYGFETLETVEYHGATKDSYGNIVWYSAEDTDYYQYVLVKTMKGVVTDLIVISNR